MNIRFINYLVILSAALIPFEIVVRQVARATEKEKKKRTRTHTVRGQRYGGKKMVSN